MHLNIAEDGAISIRLEPDNKQVVVNIGGAEVWLTGGTVGTPGEGPQVQVQATEPTARAEVEYGKPRMGNWFVDVRIVPAASEGQEN